jgi:ABC-type transport system involved in multi-copper enzyme maturation permease subunit
MTWLAWRSQRPQLVVCLAAVGVLAIVLAITGSMEHSANLAWEHCVARPSAQLPCNELYARLSNANKWRGACYAVLLALPGLLGLVLGTPLVAREIENGTNRLAWTQSIGRTRWLAIKLLLAGIFIAAVIGGIDRLLAWWIPWVGFFPRIGPTGFPVSGFVDVAYGIFAFMLGAALGSLIRRTGWALAAGVPLFVGFRFWVQGLRPHLAPLAASSDPSPFVTLGSGGSTFVFSGGTQILAGWVINSGYVPDGRTSPGPGQNWNTGFNLVSARCTGTSNAAVTRCVTQLKLHWVTQYQPASHFWALQRAETAIFLGAALVLCAVTVFSVSLWRT